MILLIVIMMLMMQFYDAADDDDAITCAHVITILCALTTIAWACNN